MSGDTAVGHGLAYAMAVEGALDLAVSEEDRLVRALLLELERLHNHIADLGAMANDVGFGIVNTHAQRLRESLLRLNKQVTGHRLLRGGITIGGARLLALPDVDVVAGRRGRGRGPRRGSPWATAWCSTGSPAPPCCAATRPRAWESSGTWPAPPASTSTPGATTRSSTSAPAFRVVTRDVGDVLARYAVRAEEVAVSAALVADLVRRLGGARGTAVSPSGHPAGRGDGSVEPAPESHARGAGEESASGPASSSSTAPPSAPSSSAGLALVEAWRGTACHRVEVDGAGRLSRVAIVDPSFFTWPALPVALADTIVPDFPLANKSFNQSYAGNDL